MIRTVLRDPLVCNDVCSWMEAFMSPALETGDKRPRGPVAERVCVDGCNLMVKFEIISRNYKNYYIIFKKPVTLYN